jgi:hypothetical protein
MSSDVVQTTAYRELITELKQKVQSAQTKAAASVFQLIELYWDIGQLVTERQKASGWGDAVVDLIAHDLTRELNGAKGFSRRNLYRIK